MRWVIVTEIWYKLSLPWTQVSTGLKKTGFRIAFGKRIL